MIGLAKLASAAEVGCRSPAPEIAKVRLAGMKLRPLEAGKRGRGRVGSKKRCGKKPGKSEDRLNLETLTQLESVAAWFAGGKCAGN